MYSKLCLMWFTGQVQFWKMNNLIKSNFSNSDRANTSDGMISAIMLQLEARWPHWYSYWSGFPWSIFTCLLPNRNLTKVQGLQGLLWAPRWPSELVLTSHRHIIWNIWTCEYECIPHTWTHTQQSDNQGKTFLMHSWVGTTGSYIQALHYIKYRNIYSILPICYFLSHFILL